MKETQEMVTQEPGFCDNSIYLLWKSKEQEDDYDVYTGVGGLLFVVVWCEPVCAFFVFLCLVWYISSFAATRGADSYVQLVGILRISSWGWHPRRRCLRITTRLEKSSKLIDQRSFHPETLCQHTKYLSTYRKLYDLSIKLHHAS